ncbi:MAG: hypothetical protein JWR21_2175 [Herminiimonas sp.]|nr:hypothetical protein [Herminiimonas sp.]MDB5853445.1 hypothetical protein [Herminiimonas sp.]
MGRAHQKAPFCRRHGPAFATFEAIRCGETYRSGALRAGSPVIVVATPTFKSDLPDSFGF